MASKAGFNWVRKKKEAHEQARAASGRVSVISTKQEERATWKSKVEFMLTVVGYAVGLGNLWRFPYLAYKNGGGAFLIPYFMAMILTGIPMFLMELALGQMLNTGVLGVFQICPLFRGIGIASMIMCFWVNLYYIVIVAWAFFYLFSSFTTELPWKYCDKHWATMKCVEADDMKKLQCWEGVCDVNGKNMSYKDLQGPVKEFWEEKCLHVSNGITEMGTIRWELALALLLAWVLCYFCIFKGVAWTGKISYFTAIAPYVCILILLVRAATLPGAMEGVKYYIIPNFKKLLDSRVWIDATTQIFYSYGIGFGSLMALGSYNRFHNNIVRDAIIISVINSSTSIVSGFMVFSMVGYMAHESKKPIDEVAASGPGLAFLVYPEAVANIPGAPVWSILFFVTLIIVGLDSQFCCVEGLTTTLLDRWPELRPWRKIFLAVLVFVSYFMGLVFVAEGGMYIFVIFDNYAASGYTLLILMFFECITVSYFYGINKFYDVLQLMVGKRPSCWWKFTWLVSTPLICLAVMVYSVVVWSPVKYLNYDFPIWAHVSGIMLGLSSTIAIPVYALYLWFATKGTRKEKTLLLIHVPYTVEELREINQERRRSLELTLPPP